MSELSPEGQNEDLSNLSKEQLRSEFDSSRRRLQKLWENALTLHPDQRDNTRLVFDNELEWYRRISVQLTRKESSTPVLEVIGGAVVVIALLYFLSTLT